MFQSLELLQGDILLHVSLFKYVLSQCGDINFKIIHVQFMQLWRNIFTSEVYLRLSNGVVIRIFNEMLP